MCTLRIRRETETRFQYPANIVRLMRQQIERAMVAMRSHYSQRHQSPIDRQAARNWADEVRRIDYGSGYSTALAQTLGKL